MKVRILGCSGGIGGCHLRTTSIMVDHDILIDAGTGLGDLSIPELAQINHLFLTHTHLDHIACLPLMVDTVGDMRERPLTVHATEAVIETLHAHVFNWLIWPDFCEIPGIEKPFMKFQPLNLASQLFSMGVPSLRCRLITPYQQSDIRWTQAMQAWFFPEILRPTRNNGLKSTRSRTCVI